MIAVQHIQSEHHHDGDPQERFLRAGEAMTVLPPCLQRRQTAQSALVWHWTRTTSQAPCQPRSSPGEWSTLLLPVCACARTVTYACAWYLILNCALCSLPAAMLLPGNSNLCYDNPSDSEFETALLDYASYTNARWSIFLYPNNFCISHASIPAVSLPHCKAHCLHHCLCSCSAAFCKL